MTSIAPLTARRPLCLALIASAAAALPAAAADGLDRLRACAAVRDASARLACYDAEMQRLGKVSAPAAAVQAPQAPTQAPAGAATAAPPPPAAFGLPQRPEAELQSISSRIAGRFEGWHPGARVTLANGQVWEVIDGTRGVYDLDRPAARVRRGMLGSFFLEVEGVSATPKVRRVQ